MKAASIKQLKEELSQRTSKEVLEHCLRLAKFKLECKELLTYLLFEADDEESYIAHVKEDMEESFRKVNRQNYYMIKWGINKILRKTKKQIRFSKIKETEVELLIHFLKEMRKFTPSPFRSKVLKNTYIRQLDLVKKKVSSLHEDLQYDYDLELEKL